MMVIFKLQTTISEVGFKASLFDGWNLDLSATGIIFANLNKRKAQWMPQL